jgi:hypothetical protein
MTHSNENLPLAHPTLEQSAIELFPPHVAPEAYAARNAHRWGSFSFAAYRYSSEELTKWTQRLGDLLFQHQGAPTIAQLRQDCLTAAEIAEIEAAEADQRRRGDL